jgi:hypothetical protein
MRKLLLIPGLCVILLSGCEKKPQQDYSALDRSGMYPTTIDELKKLKVTDPEVVQLVKLKQAGASDEFCMSMFKVARSRNLDFVSGESAVRLSQAGYSDAQILEMAQSGQIDLLRELLTVLSGEGAKVIGVLHGDPSATLRLKARCEPDQIFAGIVRGIAGSDDRTALLRATCAVGAIQTAVIATSQSHPGPSGAWVGFDDEDRAVVIKAAAAALHSAPSWQQGSSG